MFVDEVLIKVIGGKGGDGCTAFHREKFVAMGGPDGGNGGRGSNIIFVADKNLKTLIDLKVQKTIKGNKGENGKGSSRNGANATDIYIKVPMGTTIMDVNDNTIIEDLVTDKQETIVCYGGRGGRGNRAFATHSNPAPKVSELGEPGEERVIRCELKVLADVGLIGLPSVGKSTILSLISASKPKIAAYHFTTLTPNLGVVSNEKYTYTIADLPGLISGASTGAGLGDKFLKHAMRTKILAHVLDMGAFEGRDPLEDYKLINNEIKAYGNGLENKKQIVVANKMDLQLASENIMRFKKKYPDVEVIEISALNNMGIDNLVNKLGEMVKDISSEPLYDDNIIESHIIYKFKKEKPYKIEKNNNVWVVSGSEIERVTKMTRFDTYESIDRFSKIIRKMGIEDELVKMGAKNGDVIQILDISFELKIWH